MIIFILREVTKSGSDIVSLFFTREEAKQWAIEHNLKDYVIYPQHVNGGQK